MWWKSRPKPKKMFAVVDSATALHCPYPYVFVNRDGAVRELHSGERKYLETPFLPFDGGRPYIKKGFESKNGWKSVEGFCLRSKIPGDVPIADAPNEDPNPPMSKTDQIEFLRKKMSGFQVMEQPDGTVTANRVPKK